MMPLWYEIARGICYKTPHITKQGSAVSTLKIPFRDLRLGGRHPGGIPSKDVVLMQKPNE